MKRETWIRAISRIYAGAITGVFYSVVSHIILSGWGILSLGSWQSTMLIGAIYGVFIAIISLQERWIRNLAAVSTAVPIFILIFYSIYCIFAKPMSVLEEAAHPNWILYLIAIFTSMGIGLTILPFSRLLMSPIANLARGEKIG